MFFICGFLKGFLTYKRRSNVCIEENVLENKNIKRNKNKVLQFLNLTTKYGEKGGFETPEEAAKSYWEYEKRYQKKQRDLQIAKMQKTDVIIESFS